MRGKRSVWAALLMALALVIGWGALQSSPQEQVTARFLRDRGPLEAAAHQVLEQWSAEGVSVPVGWKSVTLHDHNRELVTVEFAFGGSGFGSETAYWGVNYVPAGVVLGFQGHRWDYWKGRGAGRLYYDPEGDNTCYVEELAPCWYYYEIRF